MFHVGKKYFQVIIFRDLLTTIFFEKGDVSYRTCVHGKKKLHLPLVDNKNWAAFFWGNHLILLIFSSISKLFK